MNKFKFILRCVKSIAIVFIVGTLETGCGDHKKHDPTSPNTDTDTSVNTIDNNTTSKLRSGVFYDGEVSGLNYRTTTSGKEGVTKNGLFSYQEGDDITFKVGTVVLGTAKAGPKITPLDFIPNAKPEDPGVVNRIRFLMTLDEDGDASNGIQIADSVKISASGKYIDFDVPTAEFESNGDVSSLIGMETNTALFSVDQAKQHFYSTLEALGILSNFTTNSTYIKEFDTRKACKLLYDKIQKPTLRSQTVKIGHYTDILTLPQTKTECTNVYDTGLPDLSTCTTEYDSCASKLDLPFGGWTCVPGTTTHCSNIKACNTWATYKKTMECDVNVQFKLPNFIEKPLTDFIDSAFNVIDSNLSKLPIDCAPQDIQQNVKDGGSSMADAVGNEIQEKLKDAIKKEAEQWLKETAITTIAAAIPSGGLAGPAMMSTEVADFIRRTYVAVQPIIKFADDAKDLAEDMGFSTSCGWSDWSTL